MKNLFSIEDKIAIITGGMGQLGIQFTKTLLENKAKVAVFDIDIKKRNNFFKSQIKNPRLKLYNVDVANKKSISQSLGKVTKNLGKPSILINNAALDSTPKASVNENGPFETYEQNTLKKIIDVNLAGVIFMCQIVGGYMAKNNGGSIINISSIYGIVSPDQRIYSYRSKEGKSPFFKPVSYSVTKAGIINLSRYLATYWAKNNVRVNTLSFGGVFNNQDKQFLKGYSNRVPLGRMAKEDEYNGAILFLASKASSYMTGSNLIIDGGLTSW